MSKVVTITVEGNCPYSEEELEALWAEIMSRKDGDNIDTANQSSLGLQAQADDVIPDNN